MVAIAAGAHAHRAGCVGTGTRFGERIGRHPFSACELGHEALLLLLGAADQNRQGAEFLHGDDQRARGARFRNFLDDLDVGSERAAEAAVVERKRNAEEIVLREQFLDIPRKLARRVDVGRARCDLLAHQVPHGLEDQRLVVH